MTLTDPGTLQKLLKMHGIEANKGLGQHFLISSKVVSSITSRLSGITSVLEIGPGPGCLTAPISELVEHLTALELDQRMISVLSESAPTAKVLQIDALKVDIGIVLQELPKDRAVVSNLPYYITGPLLDQIAGAKAHWTKAILMMQAEVATKILAKPGDSDRGALSVSFQAQFDIEQVCHVPPGAFLPPPKVESKVLEFRSKESDVSPEFVKFVRVGFTQPRKTLSNNLRSNGYDSSTVEHAGLSPSVRPHQLTESEWSRLFSMIGSPII